MSIGMIIWMAAISGLAILGEIRFRLLEKRQNELDDRLVSRVRVGDDGERKPPDADDLAGNAGRVEAAPPAEAERVDAKPGTRIDRLPAP